MKTKPSTQRRKGAVKHPMQPIYLDAGGVARFKSNAIVRFLLDSGNADMNKLALMNFSSEDRIQFAQLIGYSVSGFGELHYVPLRLARKADGLADSASSRLCVKKSRP